MESEYRNGYSNPHWKADASCEVQQDDEGSFRIPVNALNIIWGNDPRFWQLTKLPEEDSRVIEFKEGAVLLQVNWIEVTGKWEIPSSKLVSSTKYKICYIIKFRADAFGWHSVPIKFKVRYNGVEMPIISEILEPYREKHDKWHEIPGGEFSVEKGVGIVEFGMYEVESDWWKGSMVLGGIKLRQVK